MNQHHDEGGCGECEACTFEQRVKEFQNKKKFRVLDTKDLPAQEIENQINALDDEGYELIAVDHGLGFFRAIPPALPQGMQIIRASDLKRIAEDQSGGSGGFSDDDIGEPL